jgi:hypothetical protein
MFDVFRLTEQAHIFIMSFTLENICSVSKNSHKLRKVYSIHSTLVTKLWLDGV